MTGGSRIVAFESGDAPAAPADATVAGEIGAGEPPLALDEAWVEDEAEPQPHARRWPARLGFGLVLGLALGWSVLWGIANADAFRGGATVARWAGLIRDWAGPMVLLAMVWIIAMRHSRREATRFGDAARALRNEAEALETRLAASNRELSLAREFLGAQARDLDSLGRMASERLAEHARQLAGLIEDNGSRVETLGSVSAAALENMEKLRGQLPVLASSTRDVTNNIAAAGRTAHGQVEDLVNAFNRLNQFGQASERQVLALHEVVDSALAAFTREAQALETLSSERFAALEARSEAHRAELEAHEAEAHEGLRQRGAALREELAKSHQAIANEGEDLLATIHTRASALRDDSARTAAEVRAGEASALTAWQASVERLEQALGEALAKVSAIDEQALSAASGRIAAVAAEAEAMDQRLAERDHAFDEAIGQRLTELTARIDTQFAALDAAIDARKAAHEAHFARLGDMTRTLDDQIGRFGDKIGEVAQHGTAIESGVGASIDAIHANLAGSREALAGTDAAVAALTDSSVRLLELIQGSVQHSKRDLPVAIGASEARLADLEARVRALGSAVAEAEAGGLMLADHVAASHSGLAEVASHQADLHAALGHHADSISTIHSGLIESRTEADALAAHADDKLRVAIAALGDTARAALRDVEALGDQTAAALAARIGQGTAEAIDTVFAARTAEIAGSIEAATTRAAGAGREAVVQMREQLARIDELAGNLEARVAHGKARAEEQIDHDFARRVALITEALNSNSIDIARALDAEVTDTAWSAYLKGDRGVFTRRAVRLLEPAEAKAVTRLFESDRGFHDHVSRYIHDFESMLRQLLSTRDGHALGITLLSSDMGKLYVALAQGIERLRS